MRHQRKIIAVLLMATTARAAADPDREGSGSGAADLPDQEASITHLKSDADCVTAKGSKVHLPAGFALDEATWAARDAEYRRLQDAETRLTAENTSLKASASGSSHFVLIVSAVAAAFAAGYALGR